MSGPAERRRGGGRGVTAGRADAALAPARMTSLAIATGPRVNPASRLQSLAEEPLAGPPRMRERRIPHPVPLLAPPPPFQLCQPFPSPSRPPSPLPPFPPASSPRRPHHPTPLPPSLLCLRPPSHPAPSTPHPPNPTLGRQPVPPFPSSPLPGSSAPLSGIPLRYSASSAGCSVVGVLVEMIPGAGPGTPRSRVRGVRNRRRALEGRGASPCLASATAQRRRSSSWPSDSAQARHRWHHDPAKTFSSET